MQRELTISIDAAVYEGLHTVVGDGNISRFIEELARPHVIDNDLESAYVELAAEEKRETAALEWSEGVIGDLNFETR